MEGRNKCIFIYIEFFNIDISWNEKENENFINYFIMYIFGMVNYVLLLVGL